MSDNATQIILETLFTIYRLIILGVTAYSVFWLGYSGWWFVLAIALSTPASALKIRG